jgi:DNA-3-methyladenine glycosylase I
MKRSPSSSTTVERCPWCGTDPLYQAYHDTEWGVPKTDDVALLEKLALEGFQSGLSWITILKKRDGFRKAFDGFRPEKVARYGEKDVARLMADSGIVRNKLKIEATIANARAYLELRERRSLASLLWEVVDGRPVINRFKAMKEVPPQTDFSKQMSKRLKSEGFRFVGPTTMYAFMQSVGMTNDHMVDCHRHAPCSALLATFQAPTR